MKKSMLIAILSATISTSTFADNQNSSIENQIFQSSFEVSKLSEQEMAETQGAFSLSTLGAGMVESGTYSAIIHQGTHAWIHGTLADLDSTVFAFGVGAVLGLRTAYPKAAGEFKDIGIGMNGKVNQAEIKELGKGIQNLINFRQTAYDAILIGASIPYAATPIRK